MDDKFFLILGNLAQSVLSLNCLFVLIVLILCFLPKKVAFFVRDSVTMLGKCCYQHKIHTLCLSAFFIWYFRGDVFMFTVSIASQVMMCLNVTNVLKTRSPQKNVLFVAMHRAEYSPPLPVPFVRDSTRGDHVR